MAVGVVFVSVVVAMFVPMVMAAAGAVHVGGGGSLHGNVQGLAAWWGGRSGGVGVTVCMAVIVGVVVAMAMVAVWAVHMCRGRSGGFV